MKRLLVALALLRCAAVIAGETSVVSESYTTKALGDGNEVTLWPGEVVVVNKIKDGLARVESEDRSWLTNGGVWVPTTILLDRRSFKRIERWNGIEHIDLSAGDYSADYYVAHNGTFKLVTFDEHDRPVDSRGRLYQSKNILWATKSVNNPITSEAIFVVLPNGTLCWPVPVDDCAPIP